MAWRNIYNSLEPRVTYVAISLSPAERSKPSPLQIVPQARFVAYMPDLKRQTVEGVGRVYFDDDGNYYPSVTTVLNEKETPEALIRWKEQNDGSGDSEHWRDIMNFKANRGTLIHYHCLNEFADGDMWSPDEASSEEELKMDLDQWDQYKEDLYWAREQAWPLLKRTQGINEDSVIDVEMFTYNQTVGYAGQFDMLYQDPATEETVLADIKTSKGAYPKHRMQLLAYKNAVDVSIDRVEVLRMNPDYQEWEVHSSDNWQTPFVEYWDEFLELRESLNDELIEEVREQAGDRVEEEHGGG